jgi:eukaryotic-like serine/threonine-protein kinase
MNGAKRFGRIKMTGVALAALIVSAHVFAAAAFADDTAMFRGNPQHTGVYNAPGVPTFTKIKWKFHTRGMVISSPAIANSNAYVGSTDGSVYAVDLETGAQKWKFATQARVTSSPAVANGIVYFGSYDGNFYAVNEADGKLKWKFQTEGERRFAAKHIHGSLPAAETMPDPFDFYLSSPVIWSGNIYFGSGDENIYALDANSGTLKWKFKTGDVVHASPAISEGLLFVGSWDTFFYALDAATGAEKWRFKTGEDHNVHNQEGIQSSAAIADGIVYFGCRDSNLYALDAHTGEKRWAFFNKGSWVIGSPAVRDGKVYFSTADTALVHALDAKSGAEFFSLKFNWLLFSSPAVAGNTLYIGSEEGKLLTIDLSTQKPGWIFQTDGSKENGAALTNANGGPKYEAVFTENFYDNMVTGVNKLFAVGMIFSSPVVSGSAVYFGSTDGNLYKLM